MKLFTMAVYKHLESWPVGANHSRRSMTNNPIWYTNSIIEMDVMMEICPPPDMMENSLVIQWETLKRSLSSYLGLRFTRMPRCSLQLTLLQHRVRSRFPMFFKTCPSLGTEISCGT